MRLPELSIGSPRGVFVDSQGWMAIVSKRDQHHASASKAYKELVRSNYRLYTSNWTLYDALSHIRERAKGGGVRGAEYLWTLVQESEAIEVLEITRRIEKRAISLFWSQGDKAWSVTTCANVVKARELQLLYVLSGNHHYEQAGLVRLYS